MSITCSICQDFLTERPQTLRTDEELIICALVCGHLFHRTCIQQWFRRDANGAGDREGICPCCKSRASLANALRVFPTGDEESDEVVRQDRNLKALTKENQMLSSNINELRRLATRTEGELEDEIVAHDVLKLEYAQVVSRLDLLKEQLNESKDLQTASEISVKSIVDKLEREKKEALELVATLEAENQLQKRDLEREITALKLKDAENYNKILSLEASLFRPSDDVDVLSEGIASLRCGISSVDNTVTGSVELHVDNSNLISSTPILLE